MNEHGKNPRPIQTAICQNIGGCFEVQGLNQSRIYLNTLKLNTSTRLNGMLNFLHCNVIPATSLLPFWLVSFLQRFAPLCHKEKCSQGDTFSFKHLFSLLRVSLVAQMVKRLSAMQETRFQSLGWENPLEKEMATHSSILAWKIPWTKEPGGL